MGLNMELIIKKYNILVGLFVFLCIPVLLYTFGDAFYRTTLKETLSIVTILSFTLIFSQFFISRINEDIEYGNKINKVLNFHKYLGYIIIAVLFFHPIYIVLPRYFEAGVNPVDAFWIMITNFQSFGVLLGIVSWILMLTLGITSYFRFKLGIEYKHWKLFHGSMSILFIITATWHVISLGRHSDYAMSIFFILLVGISMIKLLNNYLLSRTRKLGVKIEN